MTDVALVQSLPALRSPIPLLLGVCGPTAIAGLIIPVVIDAIDGHLWPRPRPQVGVESGEIAIPALADSDSSAAVVGEPLILGVLASPSHSAPNAEFWCVPKAMRRSSAARTDLPPVATARDDAPASQIGCGHLFLCSAFASAQPVSDTLSPGGGRRDYREAADLTAKHVDLLHTPEDREHAEVFNG